MGEDVKKSWQETLFSEAELREFADVGKKFDRAAMAAYQSRWIALIGEVQAGLELDPTSAKAQDLGRRWTALLDEAYGGRPELKEKIARAYQSGAIPEEHNMIAPEVWDFIRKVHAAAGRKSSIGG